MSACARCEWSPDLSDQSSGEATQRLEHAVAAGHPLCRCCGRSLPANDVAVCLPCVADVRRSLAAVEDAYVMLPSVFARVGSSSDWRRNGPGSSESALPGGDALVMFGPGSMGLAQISFGHWPDGTPWLDVAEHAEDELAGDAQPVLFELWREEVDWRSWRGEPEGAGPVSISGVVDYLNRRLGWAADTHPGFPEFADAVARLLSRLESALALGERPDRGASCQSCGSDLQRHFADPAPCGHEPETLVPQWSDHGPVDRVDECRETAKEIAARLAAWERRHSHCRQGGLVEEVWKCPKPGCQRVYTPEEYRLAVAHEMYLKRNAAHYWVPIATAARLSARSQTTVKQWANDPAVDVEVACDVKTHRLQVLLSSVLALTVAKARRRRVA